MDKPEAKDYRNIFLYCKALEAYIEELESDIEELTEAARGEDS